MKDINKLQVYEINTNTYEIPKELEIKRLFILVNTETNKEIKSTSKFNINVSLVGVVMVDKNSEAKINLTDKYQDEYSEKDIKGFILKNIKL